MSHALWVGMAWKGRKSRIPALRISEWMSVEFWAQTTNRIYCWTRIFLEHLLNTVYKHLKIVSFDVPNSKFLKYSQKVYLEEGFSLLSQKFFLKSRIQGCLFSLIMRSQANENVFSSPERLNSHSSQKFLCLQIHTMIFGQFDFWTIDFQRRESELLKWRGELRAWKVIHFDWSSIELRNKKFIDT